MSSETVDTGTAPESSGLLVRSRRRERILDYSLLLASQGIKHWFEFDGSRYSISVDPEDLDRARDLLKVYRDENKSFHDDTDSTGPIQISPAPLLFLVIPAVCFFWIGLSEIGPWLKRQGTADAARILEGEWWRCITALTLHADNEHFLGNMVSGYFLLNLLAHRAGIGGILLACTLIAGATNFVVALASGPGHNSLGYSTVVFASLGILAALESRLLTRQERNFRRLTPLFAAFFIAVMVGLGENADVKAHFYGFGLGAIAGFFGGDAIRGRDPFLTSRWTQTLMVFLCYGLFALCWAMAAQIL